MIDYQAFSEEVREFCLTHCPSDIRRLVAANGKLTREPWSRWQRILHERGWGAPNWPVAYGGTGWDVRQRHIFDEVSAETSCPPQYHHGLRHIGPVLIEFGTEEQKQRFLPGILDGSDWWCQGYSEPGAGSDLASLRTRAVRQGDSYLVSGQKMWTSHAHEADLMYTLVRTSSEGRKQNGITLLLIPMDTEGVSTMPIATIDGWHHVNEVFLDNVKVPVANRVGEENKAWSYSKFLLQRERLGAANTAVLFQLLARVRALVEEHCRQGTDPRRRALLEQRLLMAEAEMLGQRELGRRAIDSVIGNLPLGITPSILKLTSAQLTQSLTELAFELTGPEMCASLEVDDETTERAQWIRNFLYHRSRTIVGGTNEIQKNVIARELFGA